MPTFVDPKVCDSCSSLDVPQCVHICPNDLMVLLEDTRKGFNQEPEMCSECFACVKMCPQEAIEVRGYADFVPLGAYLKPHRTDSDITWDVRFRGRQDAQLQFPRAHDAGRLHGAVQGLPRARAAGRGGPGTGRRIHLAGRGQPVHDAELTRKVA